MFPTDECNFWHAAVVDLLLLVGTGIRRNRITCVAGPAPIQADDTNPSSAPPAVLTGTTVFEMPACKSRATFKLLLFLLHTRLRGLRGGDDLVRLL